MHLFDVSIAGEINLDQILYGIPREIPLEREIPATGYAVTLGSSRVIRKGEGATTGTREMPVRSLVHHLQQRWPWVLLLGLVSSLSPAQGAGQASRNAPITVSNKTMTARLTVSQGRPKLEIEDLETSRTVTFPELFAVTLKDGSLLLPSSMQWQEGFAVKPLPVTTGKNAAGKQVCASWRDERSSADFDWCLLVRSGAGYLREQLQVRAASHDVPITEVRLLDFRDAQAHVAGTVKGSPVVDGQMFFAFEHPLSWSRVVDGRVQAGMTRDLPLRARQSVTYSAVAGTARQGGMRRTFLAYLESERPRPYRPFLNYNSWYDIGYQNRYGEAAVLDRIHAFGSELEQKRHVILDSFVFDDGWDNPSSFWGFDSGFPHGFTRVAQAAAAFHAGIGVWFSPWGGYAEQKEQRIANGRAHGYEIIGNGFALSGPRYFHDFSKVCLEMVDQYHVNLFKFDGTGNADRVFPGSAFDSDFDAAIHLIRHIREREPGIFINLSTGTYPSPFWLFYADSIWRGGEDHDFAGVGTPRQRWITYRDEQTYRSIVLRGPLFPLNSLMLHGIIYAQQAKDLNTDPQHDFADEVLSYFGSGTQLQEMYITPSLLSGPDWEILARAARWSRDRAAILEDTHWVGGDPGQLKVYGWAAWAPTGWIVTLRNPSDHAQDFQLSLNGALELPSGTSASFNVEQPFATNHLPGMHWQADRPISLHLNAFEVRIFEAQTRTAHP